MTLLETAGPEVRAQAVGAPGQGEDEEASSPSAPRLCWHPVGPREMPLLGAHLWPVPGALSLPPRSREEPEERQPDPHHLSHGVEAILPLPRPSCTCLIYLLQDRTGTDSDLSPLPCSWYSLASAQSSENGSRVGVKRVQGMQGREVAEWMEG